MITSPNYPSPYPINFICNYTIAVDSSQYQTTLNFTDYDLREVNDIIQIFIAEENGGYESYYINTTITSKSMRKIYHFPLLSRVRLIFKSDFLNSGRGFKLHYTTKGLYTDISDDNHRIRIIRDNMNLNFKVLSINNTNVILDYIILIYYKE